MKGLIIIWFLCVQNPNDGQCEMRMHATKGLLIKVETRCFRVVTNKERMLTFIEIGKKSCTSDPTSDFHLTG